MTIFRWRGFRTVAWAEIALTIIVTLGLVIQSPEQRVFLLAGAGVGALIALGLMVPYPALTQLLIVTAILVNGAGYAWDLYTRWWWFDRVIHGYTLFALTMLLGALLHEALLAGFRHRTWAAILTLTSFGVTVGVLWEFVEWGYDQVVAGNVIKGKDDTIFDLLIDTLGALLAAALVAWAPTARNARGLGYPARRHRDVD